MCLSSVNRLISDGSEERPFSAMDLRVRISAEQLRARDEQICERRQQADF
jgi:hypothetical protein